MKQRGQWYQERWTLNIDSQNILMISNYIQYRITFESIENELFGKTYSWAVLDKKNEHLIGDTFFHFQESSESGRSKLWAFEDLHKLQQNAEPCFDLTHLDWTKEEGGSGGPGWTGVYLPLE